MSILYNFINFPDRAASNKCASARTLRVVAVVVVARLSAAVTHLLSHVLHIPHSIMHPSATKPSNRLQMSGYPGKIICLTILLFCLLNALMLLYADDLVLLAPDSRSLEAALLVLDQVARKWAMSVNYDKAIGVVVAPPTAATQGD